MLYADVVELIRVRCGGIVDTGFTTTIQTTLEYVKATKLERDATLRPWFLWNVAETPVAALSGATTLAMPTDYLFSDPNSFLKKQGEYDFYKRIIPEQAAQVNETDDKYYYIKNALIIFQPALTENTNFVMDYQKAQTVLSADPTNPWLLYAADLLAAETAYEIKLTMEDDAGARLEANRIAQARNRLIAETIERQAGSMI